MPEAWELAPDTERSADSTVTFIIFSEDGVCEPYYFRQFQKPGKVKVNVIGDQQSGFRNFTNTLVYCHENGLLDKGEKGYFIKEGITEYIWSVYDRDINLSEPGKELPDSFAFTMSIKTCEQAGINVAWSNDAFELWILLHFEEVVPGVNLTRKEIYERLTNLFKALEGQGTEMAKETGKEKFSYKLSMKKRAPFNQFVLPALKSRYPEAEKRARLLENEFTAAQTAHECNPCTKIHHLVNSILSFH